MGASIAWGNNITTHWAVHGPESSTEAEIQAVNMNIMLHTHALTINTFVDSKSAINAICRAYHLSHTNLHKFPNRVSLRYLLYNLQNRIVTLSENPIKTSFPTLNLIHIYSHSDTNTEKKQKNKEKFQSMAPSYISLNQQADAAAKLGCMHPNEGHHPNLVFNDQLIMYSPKSPHLHYSTTLKELNKLLLQEQFTAAEPIKANRWFHKDVDLAATSAPLHSGKASLETFAARLLLLSLPTKPVVMRSKWFQSLSNDHPKRQIYKNNDCVFCPNIKESHEHIFYSCKKTIPFKKKFLEEANTLIYRTIKKQIANIPWWCRVEGQAVTLEGSSQRRAFQEQLGWMGYIPNSLYNTFIQHTSTATADELCKNLSIHYMQCNLDIWRHRCEHLYPRKDPQPSTTPITPSS